LIVIEGCDGSGKSSCATNLAQAIDGVYYKTPSKTFWEIRHEVEKWNDYNLIFHFYLTGTLHASQEIAEILKDRHVVCDRYFYTTIAYHRCLGVDVPAGLEKLFYPPDYSFCLYANKEEVMKRLSGRENFGPHDLKFDLQDQVLEEFKNMKLELIDNSNLNIEQTVQTILQKIKV
jgi:dTMP kinase